jgi:hypothetical protein
MVAHLNTMASKLHLVVGRYERIGSLVLLLIIKFLLFSLFVGSHCAQVCVCSSVCALKKETWRCLFVFFDF